MSLLLIPVNFKAGLPIISCVRGDACKLNFDISIFSIAPNSTDVSMGDEMEDTPMPITEILVTCGLFLILCIGKYRYFSAIRWPKYSLFANICHI